MAFGSGHFGIIISAKDRASGILQKIGLNFKALGGDAAASSALLAGGLKKLVSGALIAGAGFLGLRASFRAANIAGNFEQGLARVGAISRASAADLQLLKDAAIQAGIETQFSPEEAVEGLQSLAAMGFNAQKSIQVLLPTLDLAAGGMIGVAEATSTMTSALNIFGISSDDAGITADRLLRITQLTALQAGDLQLALANVSKGAVATNQSLGEMLVVMGLVKNAGLDVSVTSTATSQALIRMAVGADKFKAIGVSIEDAQGKFRPFADVVLDTQKALSGLEGDVAKASKITELFGIRGQAAFVNVAKAIESGVVDSAGNLLTGSAAIAFMREEVERAEGTAQEFRDIMNATWNGIKRLIVGSVETIKTIIGDKFLPIFKVIGTVVKETLVVLIKVIEAIPTPILVGAAAFFVLASAALVVAGAILVIKGVALLAMIPALAAMSKAAIAAAATMWASFWPVLLILAAVAAAVGLVFALFGKGPPAALNPAKAGAEAARSATGSPIGTEVSGQTDIGLASRAGGDGGIPRASEIRARERQAAGRARELRAEEGPQKPTEVTAIVQIDRREIGRVVSREFADNKKARRRGSR